MRAIDTNILVRLLTVDDERQAKEARKILSGGDVFIATTVVLETERITSRRATISVRAIGDSDGVGGGGSCNSMAGRMDFDTAFPRADCALMTFAARQRRLTQRALVEVLWESCGVRLCEAIAAGTDGIGAAHWSTTGITISGPGIHKKGTLEVSRARLRKHSTD